MSLEHRVAVDEEMEGIKEMGQKSTPSPSLWAPRPRRGAERT